MIPTAPQSDLPKTPRTLVFSLAFYLILAGHFAVDAYSALIPAILNKLELQFSLGQNQSAWLLAAGSFSSGMSQPIFGWLGKRLNTVAFIGIGILFAAFWIPSISILADGNQLYLHYILGMIGVGIFHPMGASSVGAIDPSKRSMAISCFFVAGMAGGISGSLVGPALITYQWVLVEPIEIGSLTVPQFALLAVPGFLICLPAYLAARSVHRRQAIRESTNEYLGGQEVTPRFHASVAEGESRSFLKGRYYHLIFLYLAAATRFFVNMAVVFLMVRFAAKYYADLGQSGIIDPADASNLATQLAGRLQAFMITGMAIGGMAAGFLIRQGKERLPLIFVPIVFAPVLAAIPHFDPWVGGPVLFLLTGAGFASMVPVSVALAQRLLPQHTGLASGMMMGGAWAFAMLGPPTAGWLLDTVGLQWAFVVVASWLLLAGCLILPAKNINHF